MTNRPTRDEVHTALSRIGDEAFLTPAQRIAFRAEAGFPAERINAAVDAELGDLERDYLGDQADRPRFLRGQRRRRAYYWLVAFYRTYEVTLWAAVVTGISAALIVWWARSL